MRAVAKAARTNTPAVYRRFNDRGDLIRGLLLWSVARLRTQFQQGDRLDAMAEAYLEFALDRPNEYQLFYSYDRLLNPKKRGKTRAPIRESRPNFAFTEEAAAKKLGASRRIPPLWYCTCGLCFTVRRCCCSRNLFPKATRGH